MILDPGSMLLALLADCEAGRDRGECAFAFHAAMARLWALGAAEACRRVGSADVFMSGGCMQNSVFVQGLREQLECLGLVPHMHREVPPNDGGIAFGQAAWLLGAGTG